MTSKTILDATQTSEKQNQNYWQNHPEWHLLNPSEKSWILSHPEKAEDYLYLAQQRKTLAQNFEAPLVQKILQKLEQKSTQLRQGEPIDLPRLSLALDKLNANKKLVTEQIQRLKNLPPGIESQIWKRFLKRFENETSGDWLNPELMENFRQSIQTTFSHLARVLEIQAQWKQKLNQEKFFWLRDTSGNSIGNQLTEDLSFRLNDWLDQKISLREWAQSFENLLQRQMPQNLKEFNEHYTQVFNRKFWQQLPRMQPMFYPNFTQKFGFQTEGDFLNRMTMNELKAFPEKIKSALEKDLEELLSGFFSSQEKSTWNQKFKALNTKEPAKTLQFLQNAQIEREKRQKEAFEMATRGRRLLIARNIRGAQNQLEMMRKRFGSAVLKELRLQNFEREVYLKNQAVESLENQIKKSKDPRQKRVLQSQLLKLCDESNLLLDYQDPNAIRAEIQKLQNEVQFFCQQKNFSAAKSAINRLYSLDAIKAYSLEKRIEAQEKTTDQNHEKKDSKKQKESKNSEFSEKKESSHEKEKKIIFYNGCIEHAKKVMEECARLGIPVDDPNYWGSPEGVRNRVGWLKKNGLYSQYVNYNSSDPNVPKAAQAGGFRFRWLDGIGNQNLTSNKADSGLKYLARYKESGYALCALAGAFSINWKGPSSDTLTPKQFIEKIQTLMSQL